MRCGRGSAGPPVPGMTDVMADARLPDHSLVPVGLVVPMIPAVWTSLSASVPVFDGGKRTMDPLEADDPRQAGPYTLLGRLGAGGMGAVYLGRSAGGRTVAVKLVRREFATDEDFRARFRREVEAARA